MQQLRQASNRLVTSQEIQCVVVLLLLLYFAYLASLSLYAALMYGMCVCVAAD